MSSWKQSFEASSQDLELAYKKKQALDDLLAKNRMSHPTYEYLLKGLEENISELEARQRSVAGNMKRRADELEKQINLIEMFLASLEIYRIGHEIDEDTYVGHKSTYTLGLEATAAELGQIREALVKIGP